MSADGAGRRQVTQLTPGSSWDREPQWSPDGKKLAFVRDDLVRKSEAVFTVNLDGTGLFQVTPWTLHAGGRPDWSPDGKWIVVTRRAAGRIRERLQDPPGRHGAHQPDEAEGRAASTT